LDLENRVAQRTQDLKEKNDSLNIAMQELKHAEAQLVQAEKMSSLGVLTAGIAHEINNAVNFISGNINPLKTDVDDLIQVAAKYIAITPETLQPATISEINNFMREIDLPYTIEETHHLLAGMEDGTNRTTEIVKNLRTFSRLDEGALKLTNIHHNIDSTLMLLKNQYRDRVTIIKQYGDVPEIEVFPGKINQVIMNMLVNAIHAIPETGEVYISTMRQANNIVISIRDTGVGIRKEHISKIFEPFFTTKDVGKGTGLGLSISYTIIQEHHGTIDVKSDIGKGCEFIITLPIMQGS
jgi:two-component system NtrC family sensor kinase